MKTAVGAADDDGWLRRLHAEALIMQLELRASTEWLRRALDAAAQIRACERMVCEIDQGATGVVQFLARKAEIELASIVDGYGQRLLTDDADVG